MKYSNIKSPYIKKQLKKTIWQDRKYLDDLIQLHKYMIKGINSWISASHFDNLKFKYQKEYLELSKEKITLNPDKKRTEIYHNIILNIRQRNKKIAANLVVRSSPMGKAIAGKSIGQYGTMKLPHSKHKIEVLGITNSI